jgi:hypothetical protein
MILYAKTSVSKLSKFYILILFILGNNYNFNSLTDTKIRLTFFYKILSIKIFTLALTRDFIQ